jgi:hypothetical protein
MCSLSWRLSCAFLALIFCAVRAEVRAFDIAVYFDARSGVNWRSQDPDSSFCWRNNRTTVLNNISSANEQQVFDWLAEMGVSHVIVHYPFASDFSDLLGRDLHDMQILNASWPGEAFKYLKMQQG